MKQRKFCDTLLLLCFLLTANGCQHYTETDRALLGQYGGHYTLSGEGPGFYMAPVGAVIFDDSDRTLTDEDFAAVFPALRHMDPMVLLLRGGHTISDRSIPLLNQLRAMTYLDLSGTRVSVVGVRALRLRYPRELNVSPETITDEQAAELKRILSLQHVTRWQAPTGTLEVR